MLKLLAALFDLEINRRRLSVGWVFLVLTTTLAACEEMDAFDSEIEMDATSQPVQFNYHYRHFEYLKLRGTVGFGNAVIYEPQRHADSTPVTVEGIPIRTACGATFITPNFAITAAHCVDGNSFPTGGPVTLQNIEISTISKSDFMQARVVNTDADEPADWYLEHPFTDGYNVTNYTCTIEQRCDERYGDIVGPCDYANGNPFNSKYVDIALLFCRERPETARYYLVSKYSKEQQGSPVCMHWFHEVSNMPTDEPPAASPLYNDWYHYTRYLGGLPGRMQNYHYYGDDKNQPIPLRTKYWYMGKMRINRRIVSLQGGTMGGTDLFGCHGSSGGGVFSTSGGHRLLGPAVNLSGNAWEDRLCVDVTQTAEYGIGKESLMYTRLAYTRGLTKYARDQEGMAFPMPGE